MRALEYWKTVTMDRSNLLERLFALLGEHDVRYCVIGGQAVNAYVEPLVSLDLDIVVAVDRVGDVHAILGSEFQVVEFPHSLNISAPGSDVRVQVQLDERYFPFLDGALEADVLGIRMPVARVEDVLRGKIWAAQDSARRGSKRQKDLADIGRLVEAFPRLRSIVPPDILGRLY